MSLFGTSPENAPSGPQQSLFDDEPNPVAKTSAGLFEEDAGTSGDSPWAFPTPKKSGRSDLVKTLLPGSDVPDSYIDAFDALLEIGEREGGGVSIAGIERVLSGSGLGTEDQSKILQIVAPGGQDSAAGIGRSEFNVLLALIGLAQEKEDITLDAVDERRRNLPQPSIPALKVALPPYTPDKQRMSEQSESPATAKTAYATPSDMPAQPQPRAVRKPSFGLNDQDPWGSPALHRGHNHPNSSGPNSQINGAVQEENGRSKSTNGNKTPGVTSAGGGDASAGDWVGYNASSGDDFSSAAGVGGEGYGGSGRQAGRTPEADSSRRLVGGGRVNQGGAEETVRIIALPDKEGIFLFQHRNYEVFAVRRNSKVIRRYSDFVWLLDCLHKKYPFRQLPLLPPKRVAINGNHIAADNQFLERRRRGLTRFANALVRHPVLSQEQLVVMFFTVPTELAVWRKQATISLQEEFAGKPLPSHLEDSLPPILQETFDTARAGIRRSAEVYVSLCVLMERLIKRKDSLAAEYLRFSQGLQSLIEVSFDTYKIDTNDVPLLNDGINSTAKHLSSSHLLLQDECRTWDEGVLEDLKRQRDCLVSMRDIFDRRDRQAKSNIDQLERRIQSNESKLAGIRARPDGVRPGEAEKVEDAIVKDKQAIVDQHNRGLFIKECIRDELRYFQRSQYQVSRLHQDWSQERIKYAELQADNWRALSEELESMPLGD